jgi:cellulose synthase/poly-beta-1,6-N-acetylglucosamine synthase-like glycosyltransferase
MFDFSHFLTDTQSIVFTILLVLALIFCCLYYGLFHFRIGRWHRKDKPAEGTGNLSKDALPPASVVLTAHNDAAWLKENLVYLLEQDYPDFEVVVVDYLSQDDTPSVLKLLKDYYPKLKIVPFVGNISVREGVSTHEDVNLFQGKKYPLSIGI